MQLHRVTVSDVAAASRDSHSETVMSVILLQRSLWYWIS
jgi:hypothetical protein